MQINGFKAKYGIKFHIIIIEIKINLTKKENIEKFISMMN
jgi:hypothetical protein